MAIDDLCIPCMSLVGAGPRVDPHTQLRRVEGYGDDELFQCTTCDAWWAMRRLGWGRADPAGA